MCFVIVILEKDERREESKNEEQTTRLAVDISREGSNSEEEY
jgi:hypothetical protein